MVVVVVTALLLLVLASAEVILRRLNVYSYKVDVATILPLLVPLLVLLLSGCCRLLGLALELQPLAVVVFYYLPPDVFGEFGEEVGV